VPTLPQSLFCSKATCISIEMPAPTVVVGFAGAFCQLTGSPSRLSASCASVGVPAQVLALVGARQVMSPAAS
jgi:hypothetical protein